MKRAIIIILLLCALILATACDNSEEQYDLAVGCLGQSTAVLLEQVGMPVNVRYYPNSNGIGIVGEWTYRDFTVYLYRNIDGEDRVTDVIKTNEDGQAGYETAVAYIGKPLSDLQEKIGLPESENYASSCLGDGEDGELYYQGFTVYTYRDTDGTENVYDVMMNGD